MIVIDASIFIAAIIDDESDEFSDSIYELITNEEITVVVPPIFYYEVANVFLQVLRRKRITKEKYHNYLEILSDFPLFVDGGQLFLEVANLAEVHSLTVYDASYLEVARRNGCLLATLDKQLSKAASNIGVKFELNG
ncbi:MAG: type II toxin-antitoxin system VapC family toxin [Rickettsiales bacterium]